MIALPPEAEFIWLRFIKDYAPVQKFDGPTHGKGEVVQVVTWLAKELIELGYAVWEKEHP